MHSSFQYLFYTLLRAIEDDFSHEKSVKFFTNFHFEKTQIQKQYLTFRTRFPVESILMLYNLIIQT